jgi:AcrR family transcriptional regulator
VTVRRPGRPGAGAHADPQALLDASARVFAAVGYDGATTRGIAAQAGVNVSTLAWHFGDKEALYAAVIDRVYARLLAVDLHLETLPAGAAERLRELVARLYGLACAHRSEVRMLLRHVLDTHRLPERVRERWLPQVLARVAEALAVLDLPPGDHRLALLSINHLLARYAVTDPEDLAGFTMGAQGPQAGIAAHLGEVAERLLMPGPTPAGDPPRP